MGDHFKETVGVSAGLTAPAERQAAREEISRLRGNDV